MESESSSRKGSESSARKGRGPSRGMNPKYHGQRFLQWDAFGNPFGPWIKDFKKHVGELGRNKIPISYRSWHVVPDDLKELIWLDLQVTRLLLLRIYILMWLDLITTNISML